MPFNVNDHVILHMHLITYELHPKTEKCSLSHCLVYDLDYRLFITCVLTLDIYLLRFLQVPEFLVPSSFLLLQCPFSIPPVPVRQRHILCYS